MTRRCCFYLVIAFSLVTALVSALAQAAGEPIGRPAPASPPPDPFGRWLATRPPVAPFVAETLYSSVPKVQPLAGDEEPPEPNPDMRHYLIVVKQSLYPSIQGVLATYISDVENEGLTVELIQISGGTAEDLRNLLISEWGEPDSLEGCFLIGDLPVPWFTEPGDSTFPCDLYLMDMDGDWIDTDSDGKPDLHTSGSGDEGPEIYCGRLLAHNLTLESGQDEVSLITRYLNKVHDYRQGLATTNVTACLYTDDDWVWWHSHYYTRCGYAWGDREEYYDEDETIAWDYKQKIQTPYEYMRLGCHSWSGGHSFKTTSGWNGGSVYSSDLVNNPPNVLFYNLYACSNARWTSSNCMGCWYIMSGAGLGDIGSTKSGSMNDGEWFYRPIGQFYPMGYAVERWFDSFQPYDAGERGWTFGMLWLGDPTLWRSRVAPGEFALTSPPDGTMCNTPSPLLEWEASTPVGVYETVTYKLVVDDDGDFSSPELVVEEIPETHYQLGPSDGLVGGLEYYWKVEAITDFGKSTTSTNTWTFTPLLDTDGDGMPDWWENCYPGLDPYVPDGDQDLDSDGATNYEEFVAGTWPNDPGSVFRIIYFQPFHDPTYGDGMLGIWEYATGRLYDVFWSDSFEDPWQPLTDSGPEQIDYFIDTGDPELGRPSPFDPICKQRFYKVEVQLLY